MFRSPLYESLIQASAERFPRALIFSPREEFSSSAHWLARWPDLCMQLSALAFITDPDGWIGAGCYRELTDAAGLGVPLWHCNGTQLAPLLELRFDSIVVEDWNHYAHICLPAPDPGAQ